MEMSVIIGFISLSILIISQIIIIGIWIGSNNTSNRQRDKAIENLSEDNKQLWVKVSSIASDLHALDTIHQALKTQAEALSMLSTALSKHLENPPICSLHIEMAQGSARRDEQIKDIKEELKALRHNKENS